MTSTTKRQQVLDLLNVRHFVRDYTPPPENVILKIREAHVGSLGNFCCFVGLPKAGKSTFINALIASPYTAFKSLFNISLELPPERPFIAYFDTESALNDFYKNIDRIKYFTQNKAVPFELHAYQLRQDSFDTIRLMIDVYLETHKHTSVVIVDGLLDLLLNFNDEKESRLLIDYLKQITSKYNILLIGVVHTGKKDNNTIGHFGSMIDRYAQSVIEVIKDKENNIFLMKSRLLRSSADFSDVAVMWNGREYIEVAAPPPPKKK
jgi:KaiC/GvpD/RAD55 family RecA-like ATPase